MSSLYCFANAPCSFIKWHWLSFKSTLELISIVAFSSKPRHACRSSRSHAMFMRLHKSRDSTTVEACISSFSRYFLSLRLNSTGAPMNPNCPRSVTSVPWFSFRWMLVSSCLKTSSTATSMSGERRCGLLLGSISKLPPRTSRTCLVQASQKSYVVMMVEIEINSPCSQVPLQHDFVG